MAVKLLLVCLWPKEINKQTNWRTKRSTGQPNSHPTVYPSNHLSIHPSFICLVMCLHLNAISEFMMNFGIFLFAVLLFNFSGNRNKCFYGNVSSSKKQQQYLPATAQQYQLSNSKFIKTGKYCLLWCCSFFFLLQCSNENPSWTWGQKFMWLAVKQKTNLKVSYIYLHTSVHLCVFVCFYKFSACKVLVCVFVFRLIELIIKKKKLKVCDYQNCM